MFLTIEKYFIWLILYSIMGWCYETTLCSVREKKFVNRGFLNGPYCPIYGWGAVMIILALGWIQNPEILFVTGAVLTCTLEYITSYVMEKMFHARWWDYTNRKFNINGRVCLLGAVVFGSFSVILIKFLHPPIADVTDNMPVDKIHIITVVFFVIYGTDNIITFGSMSGFKDKLIEYAAIMEEKVKLHANKEALNEFLSNLNYQQRRILSNFPHVLVLDKEKILEHIEEIRQEIKKHI